jgi:hypothetical protein
MEKRSFDRHDIDDMQSNQRRVEDSRKIEAVRLRVARVLGGVDADEDFLDQARDLRLSYRDNMARGYASRGRAAQFDCAPAGRSEEYRASRQVR